MLVSVEFFAFFSCVTLHFSSRQLFFSSSLGLPRKCRSQLTYHYQCNSRLLKNPAQSIGQIAYPSLPSKRGINTTAWICTFFFLQIRGNSAANLKVPRTYVLGLAVTSERITRIILANEITCQRDLCPFCARVLISIARARFQQPTDPCSSLQGRLSIVLSRQIRAIYHPEPIRITCFQSRSDSYRPRRAPVIRVVVAASLTFNYRGSMSTRYSRVRTRWKGRRNFFAQRHFFSEKKFRPVGRELGDRVSARLCDGGRLVSDRCLRRPPALRAHACAEPPHAARGRRVNDSCVCLLSLIFADHPHPPNVRLNLGFPRGCQDARRKTERADSISRSSALETKSK